MTEIRRAGLVLSPDALGAQGVSPRSDRKPESELRHWSTYASVGEWYDDYHGYVPSMMAVGLSQLMRKHPELTFPEAYASLRRAGSIIELHPDDQPRCEVCGEPLGPETTPRSPS